MEKLAAANRTCRNLRKTPLGWWGNIKMNNTVACCGLLCNSCGVIRICYVSKKKWSCNILPKTSSFVTPSKSISRPNIKSTWIKTASDTVPERQNSIIALQIRKFRISHFRFLSPHSRILRGLGLRIAASCLKLCAKEGARTGFYNCEFVSQTRQEQETSCFLFLDRLRSLPCTSCALFLATKFISYRSAFPSFQERSRRELNPHLL